MSNPKLAEAVERLKKLATGLGECAPLHLYSIGWLSKPEPLDTPEDEEFILEEAKRDARQMVGEVLDAQAIRTVLAGLERLKAELAAANKRLTFLQECIRLHHGGEPHEHE